MEFEVPQTGALEGGGELLWEFAGEYGQVISLSAERFPPNPESNLDLALALYNSEGELLAEDDNSSVGKDALIAYYPIAAQDTYQVLVKNLTTWEGGDFRLSLSESSLPNGCQTPFGEMIVNRMSSSILGYDMRYRVYLPPCHETTQQRYPYVILGHGSNSSDEHWEDLGIIETIARGIALNRLNPMAIVLPWGGELANTNTFRENASWEWVVINELIPQVEASYCLLNSRAGRAIGGISRGGFWAFEIAFRHPDVFSSLGGHSPYFDLYHAPPEYNPLDLVSASPPNPPLRIWIDRGKNDYAQVNIDLAVERLTQNGIEHEMNLYPVGQHENAYWSAHLDDYLAFYSRGFDGLELPPCY